MAIGVIRTNFSGSWGQGEKAVRLPYGNDGKDLTDRVRRRQAATEIQVGIAEWQEEKELAKRFPKHATRKRYRRRQRHVSRIYAAWMADNGQVIMFADDGIVVY